MVFQNSATFIKYMKKWYEAIYVSQDIKDLFGNKLDAK